jgi:hypothetical protein
MVINGDAIYKTIEAELLPNHKGEVVAIDVDSGDYFLGKTGIEATDKAREKHPNKIFYLVRIGARAYVSFKGLAK